MSALPCPWGRGEAKPKREEGEGSWEVTNDCGQGIVKPDVKKKKKSQQRLNTSCAEIALGMGQPWSCHLCYRWPQAPRYPQELPALISRVTFCSRGHFAFSRTDERTVLDAVLGFARENISLGVERAERVNW